MDHDFFIFGDCYIFDLKLLRVQIVTHLEIKSQPPGQSKLFISKTSNLVTVLRHAGIYPIGIYLF